MLALTTLLAQGELPDQGGDFEVSPGPFVAMLLLGFVLGAVGHMYRSRFVVAVGVLLIFLATVLIPVALHATR